MEATPRRLKNLGVQCNALYGARDWRTENERVEHYETVSRPHKDWQEVKLHFHDGHTETQFWYSFYEELATYREGDYTLVTFT